MIITFITLYLHLILTERFYLSIFLLVIQYLIGGYFLILLRTDFLAFIFLLIYCGAVVILFLFLLLLLNINYETQLLRVPKENLIKYSILLFLLLCGLFLPIFKFFFESYYSISQDETFYNNLTSYSMENVYLTKFDSHSLTIPLYFDTFDTFIFLGILLLVVVMGIVLILQDDDINKNK